MKKILILGLVFVLIGCVKELTENQINGAVKTRAEYDLDCKEDKIVITKLQENRAGSIGNAFLDATYGAAGCDKKTTYTVKQGRNENVLVYKEGAAPNDIVVQGGVNPIQPYKAPSVYSAPYKPYQPYGSVFK